MYSPDPSWQKVLKYFNGDARKTALWFGTGNPMLGGISPLEMIQLGRREKLDKFIDRQLAANGPPTTEGVDVAFDREAIITDMQEKCVIPKGSRSGSYAREVLRYLLERGLIKGAKHE